MSKVKTSFLTAEDVSVLPSSIEVIDKTTQGVYDTSADAVIVNGSASKAAVYGSTTVKGFQASGSVKSVAGTRIADTAATVESSKVTLDDYINATLVAGAKSEVEKGYVPVTTATAETKIKNSTITILGTAKATDVFAGAVLTDTVSTKLYMTNRTASIENATVNIFSGNVKNVYTGGIGANSYTVNATVNLEDAVVSKLYVGGKLGSHTTGDVVINVSDSEVKNIYLASKETVHTGNVTVNLNSTANVSNITNDGYSAGIATVNFVDYEGEFKGTIKNVDVIGISGKSAVTFTKSQDSSLKYAEYVVSISEENAYSQNAIMTFKSDVSVNNLTVSLASDIIDAGTFSTLLVSANTKKFNSDNFDVNAIQVITDNGLIADYMYDFVFETTTDKKGNVSETGNLYFTYTGLGLQVTAEGYKNNVLSSANDDVTFVYSHNSELNTDASVIAFDFATMDGNDTVTVNSDIFYAGNIDLGKGNDTINVHGYLDSLKLGAGKNTVVINGCINAENIQINAESENTFVLNGKLAKSAYSINTERNITGLVNKTYIYEDSKSSSSSASTISRQSGGSSSSTIVKVKYTKYDEEGNVVEVYEVPYIDSYEREVELRDIEDANWLSLSTQTAQQFIVDTGKNTLIVSDDAGVGDIIMSGDFAKVILKDAASFGTERLIDLSTAAASVLVVGGNINKLNFRGSRKDSTIIFDDDTTITTDSISGIDNGSTKIVLADGINVTISDLDTESIAALNLTLGQNSVFAGEKFMRLSDNFNGIIGKSSEDRVTKDIYATSLTDAVIYTNGKFVAYGTVSGSLVTAENIYLTGATVDSTSTFFGTKNLTIAGKTSFSGKFLANIDDYSLTGSALEKVTVSAGADFTIGSSAILGKIAEMTVNAAKVTLEQEIQATTLNLIGEGDFDFNGEVINVRKVNLGYIESAKELVTFNGNVDKIFDQIYMTDVDFNSVNSVLKFAKDADLTEHKLRNITFTLTNTILELADNVTVTLEKNWDVADDGNNGTNISVSATISQSFGVKGGTIAGNIEVQGNAPISGQPALAVDGTKFTGTVTANDIIALDSTFEDNVTALTDGIMATNTVFNGKTIVAENVDVAKSEFAQTIGKDDMGVETIQNLTAVNSKFNGDVTVVRLRDTDSTFAGDVTVTNPAAGEATYLTGSKIAGDFTAEFLTANLTGAELKGNVKADVVVMDKVTMTGSDLTVTATNNAGAAYGISISNGSNITADLVAQNIAIADSTVTGDIVEIESMALALDNATINGNIGNYEKWPAALVTIEGTSTVSGRVDAKVIHAGEEDGTLTADIIRVDDFGGDTKSGFTTTINARKVIELTKDKGILFTTDNKVILTTTEEIANTVNVANNGNATINADVDAVINVGENGFLGGNIVMREDMYEVLGVHNIFLGKNATLNGNVKWNGDVAEGHVILQANANIGGNLTGNVDCGNFQLSLADKTFIDGTVSNVNEIFVKEGSATITALADGSGILDKLVGSLVVTEMITDDDTDIILGRVAKGDDPAYNTAITANNGVMLYSTKSEDFTLTAEKGTQDSITGEVMADNLTIKAADEHASLTLSDVKNVTKLTVGENANITGTAQVSEEAIFGIADKTLKTGIIADTRIDGQLYFVGTENKVTLANRKATVGKGTTFKNNLTIDFTNTEDSSFDSTVTALDTTSKNLKVTVKGNAELGVVDMGIADDEGTDYLVKGTNTINVTGTDSDQKVKFAGIKSEGNLAITVKDATLVSGTITHEDELTLTGGNFETNVTANVLTLNDYTDLTGNVTATDLTLNNIQITGTVTADNLELTAGKEAFIFGELTVNKEMILNDNGSTLSVVTAEDAPAAINGDFTLTTNKTDITGNLTGTVTLVDDLNLTGDANVIKADSAEKQTITIGGTVASIDLNDGTDDFSADKVGSLTSAEGKKTVTVVSGSTGTIDLSNATESTITLGIKGSDDNAASFGAVIGSEGIDTVTLNAGISYTFDEYGKKTDIKFSTFKSIDLSKIDYKAAYGETEPAQDSLIAVTVPYDEDDAHVTITDGVKFANLSVTGHIISNFTGADNAIAGTTNVTYVNAEQAAKSIGKYGPIGQPDNLNVGAIYKDVLTILNTSNAKIEGTVDMGKGADVIEIKGGYVDIDAIKFGTSETIVSQAEDQSVFANPEADQNYDTLKLGGTLTSGSISFEGNLLIDNINNAQIKAYGTLFAEDMIVDPINELSAEYANTYGADPSNPQWTSKEYVIENRGELKFNLTADKTAVESVTFVAKEGAYDLINGGEANQELTVAKALTVTGNINMGTGDDTLILNGNLTLQGFGNLSALNTLYTWNGKEFVGTPQDGLVYNYENVGELTFGGNGTIQFNGTSLTAETVKVGGDLTITNAGTVNASIVGNATGTSVLDITDDFTMKNFSSIAKINVGEDSKNLSFSDTEVVALDTTLCLDWMDQAGESFTLNEGVAIENISDVLANTKLVVSEGSVLTFEATSDTTGKFAGTGYAVAAVVNDKSIKFTYATLV